jgi:hypothetical protein
MHRLFTTAILFTLASALWAQDAELSGLVKDPSEAVVARAKLRIRNLANGYERTTETNDAGAYSFPSLQPATYEVEIGKQGFQTLVRGNLKLEVGQRARVDFALRVGDLAQSLTVAGGADLINSSDGSVSTVVDRQFIENTPLNGRSFQTLIELTPGIVLTQATDGNPGQFSVNGQRSNANYLTVDGVSANVGTTPGGALGEATNGSALGLGANGTTGSLVSADALQEFRVQTSSYAPEYGRSPGAQIAIATRSGTNEFHGSLSEYLRNDKTDANDWFANRNGIPRPALRQNDFGGVFGGPVRLPFYNGRNKTFFFLSYEGVELRLPQAVQANVPAPSLVAQLGSQYQAILGAFPKPNLANGANGIGIFAAGYSDPLASQTGAMRLDHSISSRANLFLRYNESRSEASARTKSDLANLLATDSRFTTVTIGSNVILTPRLFASLRANYSVNSIVSRYTLDTFGGAVPFPDSVLFPAGIDPVSNAATFTYTPGSFAVSRGAQTGNIPHQANVVGDLLRQSGRHQFKFGVDYRWIRSDYDPYQLRLAYTITTQTALVNQTFTNGLAATRPKLAFTYQNLSVYAQDSWRINTRLTLTYGLRWEFNPPPSEAHGLKPVILTGLDSPATTALAPSGTPVYPTTYGNVAPRLGLAWRLTPSTAWATVLRAGGGVFYDLGSGQASAIFQAYPFVLSKGVTNSPFPLTSAQIAASITPSPALPYSNLVEYSQTFKLPYMAGWNVAIEQALGNDQNLTVSYVAALDRRLMGYQNYRNAIATSILVVNNQAVSDYQSLQIQFRRRMSKSLQSTVSYTWSHAIDDVSDESDSVIQMSRANALFDVRHQVTGAVSWRLPSPRRSFLRPLSGWSLDSIFHAQTGSPFNILSVMTAIINNESIYLRPNLVSSVPLWLADAGVPGGRRVNPAAFTAPPAGQQGNLGRDALRGLGMWQFDLSARHEFKLGERWRLRCAVDAFNVLNHPNFGLPDPNELSPTFGRPIAMFGRALSSGTSEGLSPLYQMGGPRSMQFSGKVSF